MRVDAEELFEGRSELGAHGAVEDEVGRTVDEHQHVPDVTQRHTHAHTRPPA